jgi:hypothetical protein
MDFAAATVSPVPKAGRRHFGIVPESMVGCSGGEAGA